MSGQPKPVPPTDTPMNRWMLYSGALGAVMFVLVFLVDGATRAGYGAARHPVSALSLGSRGWVQIANFVVCGALMVVFAVALRRALHPGRAATWGPLLIATFGIALIASGVFVMDPMHGYPPGTPEGVPDQLSWHHHVHDAAGLVVFTSLPAATFVFARRFGSGSMTRPWAVYSVVSGTAMVALFIAFGVAWEAANGAAGVLQRLSIGVGWAWIAAVAVGAPRSAEGVN